MATKSNIICNYELQVHHVREFSYISISDVENCKTVTVSITQEDAKKLFDLGFNKLECYENIVDGDVTENKLVI